MHLTPVKKKPQSPDKGERSYALAEHLTFLEPFLTKRGAAPEVPGEEDKKCINKKEPREQGDSTSNQSTSDLASTAQNLSNESSEPDDTDLNFLTDMLNDMKAMSLDDKKSFKNEILKLARERKTNESTVGPDNFNP
jgi:hypothetical protein